MKAGWALDRDTNDPYLRVGQSGDFDLLMFWKPVEKCRRPRWARIQVSPSNAIATATPEPKLSNHPGGGDYNGRRDKTTAKNVV